MKLFSRAQTALNDRVVWQCASLALSYPDRHRSDAAAALLEYVEGAAREHLSTTLSAVQTLDDRAAAQLYVETFDLHRRATLYLTYWTAGDTRNRGQAMLAFVQAYRDAGAVPPADEAPDHLAVVLEFAATTACWTSLHKTSPHAKTPGILVRYSLSTKMHIFSFVPILPNK